MDYDQDLPFDAIDTTDEEQLISDHEDSNFTNSDFDNDWQNITSFEIKFPYNYTILNEQDIRKRQEKKITEISTVLQVSKEAACLLLLHYNWSVSRVQEDWFTDDEKVRNAVGIVMDTLKVSFSEKEEFNCGICFENYAFECLHCVGCGHFYCNSCWEGYISTSVNDGPGCLLLRCPEPSCFAAVGPSMVDKLVINDDDKDRYRSFLWKSYVENSSMIKWCPAPGCDSAVEFVADSECYDVVCGCWYEFCWNCKEEAHRPVDCETVRKWSTKNSAESESINWILVRTKPCPKCKKPIEKNKGCMHMTCRPPCGFKFCWLCLGALSEHGKRDGGSYSCNGLVEPKQEGVVDKFEKKRNKAKSYLEKYTHYYERWGSNDLARRKALKDLSDMRNVHMQKLSDVQCQNEYELKFILDAWQQIVECRRVLKWTYAYGYYLTEQRDDHKTPFFEYLQGEAESGLERLHHCAEEELMKYIKMNEKSDDFIGFRAKLIDMTTITRNYFEKLVRALENGLSDVINSKDGKRLAHETEGSCHKRSKPC